VLAPSLRGRPRPAISRAKRPPFAAPGGRFTGDRRWGRAIHAALGRHARRGAGTCRAIGDPTRLLGRRYPWPLSGGPRESLGSRTPDRRRARRPRRSAQRGRQSSPRGPGAWHRDRRRRTRRAAGPVTVRCWPAGYRPYLSAGRIEGCQQTHRRARTSGLGGRSRSGANAAYVGTRIHPRTQTAALQPGLSAGVRAWAEAGPPRLRSVLR